MERNISVSGAILLGVIVCLAFVLRFYRVGENPAGIFCDEAALGFNAYSIAETGRDENSSLFPLFVTSFDGYKNPVFLYAAILPVKLFGLDETSIRSTSVIFGTLTVLGVFLLARELWGERAALASAFFLAITPWHIHFSRIAFELISFPCLFVFGFYFLLRAARLGGWNWIAGGSILGLTLYTYAMAFPFLALFLPVFSAVYGRDMLSAKHRRAVLLSGAVFLLLAARISYGKLSLPTAESYFWANTWIGRKAGLVESLSSFGKAYSEFYSLDFLFRSGDLWPRHSVRVDGELHLSQLPLIVVGLISLLAFPRRANLMLLWCCAIYPIGGALLTQVPSATRGVIGSALAALLGGLGLSQLLSATKLLASRWLGNSLAAAAISIVFWASSLETGRYLSIYHGEYRELSARDFQAGYREMIEFFEGVKSDYPIIYQTALDVNRPYIFEKFYTRRIPPVGVHAHSIRDYPEMALQDFLDSPANRRGVRTLFAIRPEERVYLEDYDVKKVIRRPDGRKELMIVEIGRERRFFDQWAVLGPLSLDDPRLSFGTLAIDGGKPGPEVSWRRPPNRLALGHLSLIELFPEEHRRSGLRNLCARATTQFRLDSVIEEPLLELFSSDDLVTAGLNGETILGPFEAGNYELYRAPINPRQGWNELAISTCQARRSWFFGARVSDGGKTIAGIETRPGP